MSDEDLDTERVLRRLAADYSSITPYHKNRHHLHIACEHTLRFLSLGERVPAEFMRDALDRLIKRAEAVREGLDG